HLEARVEELVAEGTSRPDAQAQARREFGSTARAAEDSRNAWRWGWLEDLTRDLGHAARGLDRDRGFAATAILSLALGIGANTTIFSLMTELLFSEPSVRDPKTLVNAHVGSGSQIPMREYRLLRDANIFDGLAGESPMGEVNWRNGDTSLRLFATGVTENYFEVTGVPVALGRAIRNGERNVALIGRRFWKSRLNGDAAVLGRSLILDGQAYTIVGVLPAEHRTLTGFGFAPDMYLPVASQGSVGLYGRLPQGVTPGAALGRLKSGAAELDQIYPDANYKRADRISVMSLTGIDRLRGGMMANVATFFGMVMAVAGLLLMIACANVASLLLARGATRVHELAIRMSIGAGRGRLVRQMLAESLLLSLLGAAAGLALNFLLTRFMNGLTLALPFPVRMSMQPDGRLLIYAALVAIASTLVAGLLPALKSTRAGTNALLKWSEHQVSGRGATLRNTLVAGQLAISVLVLITAALSIRNLIESSTLDPGFDIKRTVWAQMRLVPESYPNAARVRAAVVSTLDQLGGLPGVEAATVATFVPLNDHFANRSTIILTDVIAEGARVEYSWNSVGPDYFRTMGIEILAGREFSAQDREGAARVVILNEAIARRVFSGVNPLGRRIRLGSDDRLERTVIGVARNSKYSTIGEKDRPALYEPYLQAGRGVLLNFLVKANGPPVSILKPLNSALLDADPAAAVELKPMSSAMGFALLPSQAGAFMLGCIGVLGLALASVGLYGVLAYSISRRTREIGLRVALGAQRGQVLQLVLGEGARILSLGLTAGVVIAMFVTKPAAKFLAPGLKPSDPLSYMAVAVVLILAGFAASLIPALRALRIDATVALRYE
ncbi:MAG: ADOP family duplicated permease, partial [Bryobacteraceae bacterium]